MGGAALRGVGMSDFSPEQIRLLTHGRVVSTVQMKETLGFLPRRTTAETLADFALHRGRGCCRPSRSRRRSTDAARLGDGVAAAVAARTVRARQRGTARSAG